MRSTLKFIAALAVALLAMLAFRSLVMTVCTIEGSGMSPIFLAGDRVLVNRWSYGLRTGSRGSLFDYGRLCRQSVKKGDFIAFEDSLGQLLICRCAALPGDTVTTLRTPAPVIVPGLKNCADQDYYWVEPVGENNQLGSRQLGFIPEHRIVGRVCLILYSHNPSAPLWQGWRGERTLLPR